MKAHKKLVLAIGFTSCITGCTAEFPQFFESVFQTEAFRIERAEAKKEAELIKKFALIKTGSDRDLIVALLGSKPTRTSQNTNPLFSNQQDTYIAGDTTVKLTYVESKLISRVIKTNPHQP